MFTARTVERIAEVPAAAWDACAGTHNPFVQHGFLRALEDSGSAAPETGWMPFHVVLESAEGRIEGCAPMYAKSHSQGEYVFDHGWAQAFMDAGGRYYPKLQVAVPFSPVTGPRLLVRPDAGEGARRALLEGLVSVAEQTGVSSLHVTFPTETECRQLSQNGFLARTGEQFHWVNQNYASFDAFLGDLSARKRKSIRRERRAVADSEIDIVRLQGDDISPDDWDTMFRFYTDTGSRKWGRPYLTADFFPRLGAALGDQVVLLLAQAGGAPIAGALHIAGGDTLFGRYWGCSEYQAFLHFELCYYQAIDYAIEHGLQKVEAGAQGPHKIQRGYLPVPTYSAHWIRHPHFRDAVAEAVQQEARAVQLEIDAIRAQLSPFRQRSCR